MGAKTSRYARPPPPTRKRVVIIGGGVAGTLAAKLLAADFDVVMVDQKEYVEIVPGNVECCVNPFKFDQFYGVTHEAMHKGAIALKIGTATLSEASPNKTIVVDGKEQIEYDFLILATGRPYELFKSDGRADWRTMAGRRRSYDACRKKLDEAAHVVCAGGGAVGVEMAAEILEYLPAKKVTLVASGEALLPEEVPAVQQYALKVLSKSKGFTAVFNEKVDCATGKLLKAGTTLEGGGGTGKDGGGGLFCMKCFPSPHAGKKLGLPAAAVDDRGRIKVDTFFQVSGMEKGTVFAVGDCTDGGGRGRVKGEYSFIAKAEASACVDNVYRVCHEQALWAMPPQKVKNVVTLGSKRVCGSIIKPNGEVKLSLTGGLKSKIGAKMKGKVHRKSATMLMKASKKTYHTDGGK